MLAISDEIEFEIDETIIYPHYGAGKIIDEKVIDQGDEEKEYYVVDILLGRQTVMLPKDQLEEVGVRALTPSKEFYDRLQEVANNIEETYDAVEGEHPEKIHMKTLEAMLEDIRQGHLETTMEGLESLHTRYLNHDLNITETRTYETSKRFALGEIMGLEDIDEIEAERKLHDYLPTKLPEPPETEEDEEEQEGEENEEAEEEEEE